MNKRRKVLSTVAAAALGLAGLVGAAAPVAHASTTITITDADCVNGATGANINASPGDVINITATLTDCKDATVPAAMVSSSSDISAAAGGTNATVTPSGPSLAVDVGGAVFTSFSVTVGSANGTYQLEMSNGGSPTSTPPTLKVTTWQVTVTGGGSGGGDGSSSSATATQTFELSITHTDGTTCRNTSESGTQGTWIDLPAASDCTPPATMSGATLLGWATNPNFPVDIAKRQVDNGWGAYETFNDEGQLTGVFIPAGKPTFLSAAGKIYPIWDM